MADKVRGLKKRGQTTIFVIMALVLVVVIILFFVIYRSPRVSLRQDADNPESFLDKCMRKEVRETIDVMLVQGGFVNPEDYKIYNDIKASYLCKNVNFYEPCVMQYPRYISQIEYGIESEIKEKVEECFFLMEEELDKRNYQHSGGPVEIEVVLKPGKVEVISHRNFSFSKDDVSRIFNSFKIVLNTPLYNLAYVAQEIASQEAEFCYFEYVGYMVLYPEFSIRKFVTSDSTKIYTITDKKTGAQMNIAIRGCAIPAGF